MKKIEVVAAIIIKDGKVFSTQRGYGDLAGGWEFPGGKVEPGENQKEALEREIKEELDAEIAVGEYFDKVEYDYPTFHLTMHCYICTLTSEKLRLLEHEDAKWLAKTDLLSVDWLPADIGTVKKLAKSEYI